MNKVSDNKTQLWLIIKSKENAIDELRRLRQAMIDCMSNTMLQEYKEEPLVVQNMNWLEEYSKLEIDGMEDAMNDFLSKKYNIRIGGEREKENLLLSYGPLTTNAIKKIEAAGYKLPEDFSLWTIEDYSRFKKQLEIENNKTLEKKEKVTDPEGKETLAYLSDGYTKFIAKLSSLGVD